MMIVCAGDCGVDHYLPSGRLLAGGITANFARHALQEFAHDDELHLLTAIGDEPDAAGIVRRAFTNTRIRCHIAELPGHTPVQFIEVQADGERKFVRYDAGVLASYRLDDAARALIGAADLVVTPMFQQVRELFESIISVPLQGKMAVDFADFAQHPDMAHLESCLDRIDVAFFGLSRRDTRVIAELSSLAERWHKLFVVTLGPHGSEAFHGHAHYRQDAIPVSKVVDTTGAGDAFAAAFLACWMKCNDVAASLARGATLAARVVQGLGAMTP